VRESDSHRLGRGENKKETGRIAGEKLASLILTRNRAGNVAATGKKNTGGEELGVRPHQDASSEGGKSKAQRISPISIGQPCKNSPRRGPSNCRTGVENGKLQGGRAQGHVEPRGTVVKRAMRAAIALGDLRTPRPRLAKNVQWTCIKDSLVFVTQQTTKYNI